MCVHCFADMRGTSYLRVGFLKLANCDTVISSFSIMTEGNGVSLCVGLPIFSAREASRDTRATSLTRCWSPS